jgi:hypothetical protein
MVHKTKTPKKEPTIYKVDENYEITVKRHGQDVMSIYCHPDFIKDHINEFVKFQIL